MPQIPITSTFGYLGIAFLSLAIFLLLTGTGIIKLKNVTVKTGQVTMTVGGILLVIGVIFLVLDGRNAQSTNKTVGNQPTTDDKKDAILLLTQAPSWDLILLDAFDNNNQNWSAGNGSSVTGNSYTEISLGKYSWQINAETDIGAEHGVTAKLAPQDSFYLAVDASVVSNTGSYYYCLDFRSEGTNKFYMFCVYPETKWFSVKFRERISKQSYTLLYLPNSEIITSHSNRLAVIAVGSDYSFYINNSFVGHLVDTKLSGGLVGLIAGVERGGKATEIEFDNFEYRSLP